MTCNPNTRVRFFLDQYGESGKVVLSAYDTIDPLRCGYMPDEYLGYAERYMVSFQYALALHPEVWNSVELAEELVRRTFYPAQIVQGFVTLEAIKALAVEIQTNIWSTRWLHEELNKQP